MGAVATSRMPTRTEVRAERARRDFGYFVRLVRPEFGVQWFQGLCIERMQSAGTADHDTRLGLAWPPGHAKSEYALLFCAWMCARDPDITIKYVTYSQEFAEEQFVRLKEILELDAYVNHFGHALNSRHVVGAHAKTNSTKKFSHVQGKGWVQACGFGGGITGGRVDLIVIDDPFRNHEQANSPTIRQKRWDEYGASVRTRRRAGRPLRIVMLFTRWHLDDLAGRCKEREPDEWTWLEFDACKEAVNDDIEAERADPRDFGQALWPAVADEEQLAKERELFPETFAALWQQRPVPPGGALFKAQWFEGERRWSELPVGPGTWYQSWDPRHGGKRDAGSFAVGLLAFKPYDEARVYIVDMLRGRYSPDETLAVFDQVQMLGDWKSSTVRLVEKKGDGVMLLSLRGTRYAGMTPVSPTSDKITRARSSVPLCRAGNVVLPEWAPWLGEFLAELTRFPSAGTDDQVDALTQLLDAVFGVTAPNESERAQHAFDAAIGA